MRILGSRFALREYLDSKPIIKVEVRVCYDISPLRTAILAVIHEAHVWDSRIFILVNLLLIVITVNNLVAGKRIKLLERARGSFQGP